MIELLNVYKIYDEGENEVRALDGITFRIAEGEFVAIVGKSGSGKSDTVGRNSSNPIGSRLSFWIF